MTSRACELVYDRADKREYCRRRRALGAVERKWDSHMRTAEEFHSYLVELTESIERLFQWVDELWLYGTGGAKAFEAEIAQDDLVEPSTLTPPQAARRRNRARWRQAAALASQLTAEVRERAEFDESRRLERAYFRTVWPFLPPELQDKDVALDRSAIVSMLRGDVPRRLIAVSLDDAPRSHYGGRLPHVIMSDDPLSFEPATAACRLVGLFAEPLRSASTSEEDLKAYPRIEVIEGPSSQHGHA